MASLSRSKKTGSRAIQFNLADRKRKTIHLGKLPQRNCDRILVRVESLIAAKVSGDAPDLETLDWLNKIDAKLHDKLARVGLVARRRAPGESTLGAFLASYIKQRSDVKAGTSTVFGHTKRCLVEFFGANRPLAEITPGDAEDWRRWLMKTKCEDDPKLGGQGLAENTARRRCGIARQFFADAVKRRTITVNPFGEMKGVAVKENRERDYFITRDEADKVLATCPDSQWKLIFALSRFGGLRCPSEHLALRWGDIDWECGRIVVRSPKTEHHEGKGSRVMPLFPELRPYLQAALDELLETFDPKASRLSEQPVITRYRDGGQNLRTHMERIIIAAGILPWPKLFQNLRATRATELAKEHPGHVAAAWLGHSVKVAKESYWQVTEMDFEKALQNALLPPAATERKEAPPEGGDSEMSPDDAELRYLALCTVGDDGLEPPTYAV